MTTSGFSGKACFSVVAFLLTFCSVMQAQSPKRLHHITYNINEGLLHSQVIDIAEDGTGFIWISTGNGLQRFDGKTFFQVNAGQSARELLHDKYIKFFGLRNGNLLLVHAKGVSEYNTRSNTFTNILPIQNGSREISAILSEENSAIWCIAQPFGLYKLDKKTLRLEDSLAFPLKKFSQSILPVKSGIDSVFFVGLGHREIYIAETGSKKNRTISAGKDQGHFVDIASYSRDTVLVATGRGIEKMNIHSGVFVFISPYQTRNQSLITPSYINLHTTDNDICLINEGLEIFEVDLKQNKYVSRLTNLQNDPFISVSLNTKFFFDSQKNLWLLTENDGIRKISYQNTGFKYFGHSDKRKNFVKTIYADKSENLVFCGTVNNGILIFDTLQRLIKSIEKFPGSHPPYAIGAVYKVEKHKYLLFPVGGITSYMFNANDFTLQRIRIDTSKIKLKNVFDYHMTLMPMSDTECILQNSYAVYKMKWDSGALRFIESINLPFASVTSYLDENSRLWVGGKGRYLLFQNGLASFKTFELRDQTLIRCFHKDGFDRMWMGTEDGLFALDDNANVSKKYQRQNGLADNNIYSIHHDPDGNLWFSHNKGITSLKSNGRLIHFSKNDGLQENEFNTNASFETADGELFFGGVNGISSFYPRSIMHLYEHPRPLVTSILIKEKEWQGDTASWNLYQLTLPYHKNTVTFEFTALGLRRPEQYNYQYRMQGVDQGWINSGNRGFARYVLQPGRYIFELYTGNSFDPDAIPQKIVSVNISPPFWKTGWFLISSVILLVTAIVIITRTIARRQLQLRIRELQQKQALDEERIRIATEMHDDVGAGLTQITLMCEAAKRNEHGGVQLGEIANTSRQLVSTMSAIIWSMRTENNSLSQMLPYLREQLHRLLEFSGIEYTIRFPENENGIRLSNAQCRNVLLITKEIVHNSIKHSNAKHIKVICSKDVQSLMFEITDDGTGFDLSIKKSGNGIRNVKRRIHELRGSVDIESTPSGSRFYYKIPLAKG